MMKQEREAYCQRLVASLEEHGIQITGPVRGAFATIPRHRFVSSYYQQQASPSGLEWRRIDATESQEWFEQIYSLNPLITRVDEDGFPMSSSSDPTIMASMLDSLEVGRGQHVLEIGTGTGYNAALLAHLVGDPKLVTTIDIDPALIEEAHSNLEKTVGPGMTVVTGDGLQGHATNAPYDRIMATVSTSCVPEAWDQQLTPGGILICILQPAGAGCGGVLKAVKAANTGRMSGHIMRVATFMPAHQGRRKARRTIPLGYPLQASFPLEKAWFDPSSSSLFLDFDFQFYLYLMLPDFTTVQVQYKDETDFRTVISTEPASQGYVAFVPSSEQYQVELHGPSGYAQWNRLVQVSTFFRTLGQPKIADYRFEMDQAGQRLSLQRGQSLLYPFTTEVSRKKAT